MSGIKVRDIRVGDVIMPRLGIYARPPQTESVFDYRKLIVSVKKHRDAFVFGILQSGEYYTTMYGEDETIKNHVFFERGP